MQKYLLTLIIVLLKLCFLSAHAQTFLTTSNAQGEGEVLWEAEWGGPQGGADYGAAIVAYEQQTNSPNKRLIDRRKIISCGLFYSGYSLINFKDIDMSSLVFMVIK